MRAGYELAKKAGVSLSSASHSTSTHPPSPPPPPPPPPSLCSQNEVKWKQMADLAINKCQFGLAMECLHHAEDYGGLLLLATSAGDADTLQSIGGFGRVLLEARSP